MKYQWNICCSDDFEILEGSGGVYHYRCKRCKKIHDSISIYKGVADFFVNAPEEEKMKIINEATKTANKMQRDITNQAKDR